MPTEPRKTFDPELWGAESASAYHDADDLISAVRNCATENGWEMPDEDSIRDWWTDQTAAPPD